MDKTQIIITSVVALISAGIGSVMSPFIKWGIEKKRCRQNNRSELVENARKSLSGPEMGEFTTHDYKSDDKLTRILPYLSKELQQQIDSFERRSLGYNASPGEDQEEHQIIRIKSLHEINRLETKWKLL